MCAPVPTVEIPDHTDPLGIRRPGGKPDTANAVHTDQVRAQDIVDMQVAAFLEQVQVEVGDLRGEHVGVVKAC